MYKSYKTSDAKVAAFLLYNQCKLKSYYVEDAEKKRVTFVFDDMTDREDLARAYFNMTDISRVVAKKLFHAHADIINLIIEAQRNYENEKEKESVKIEIDKRTNPIG